MGDSTETGPSFFEAMLAVHREVETLPKDGWNDQGGYSFAKGDTVVRQARQLLARHGILWVRTSAAVTPPTMGLGSIGGKMTYAGNVEIAGKLWHARGELLVSAGVPIVVMGARPHDKAWAAAITFGIGYVLLGVLNQDKADSAEINNREDEEEALCVGAAKPIADSNRARCEELAERDGADPRKVWEWLCQQCDVPKDGDKYPGPAQLYISEGKKVGDLLKSTLSAHGPGDENDQSDPRDKDAP